MDARSRNIVAGIAVVSFGAMAYALYFDYKRRNDTQFRKQLRKEKKRVDKTKAQIRDSAPPEQGGPITTEALKEILRQIQKEEVPQTPQEKEVYFLHHVGIGEQQALQGTNFHLQAAMSFFRALRVYPSPVELMMIYQKTVPEPIFKIVMDLSNLEVSPPSSPSAPTSIDNESPVRGGPPSETSSQEWDKLTDPGATASSASTS